MTEPLDVSDPDLIRANIIAETARIPWKQLQRFFASGKTLLVKADLDLVEVAVAFQEDNANQVEQWLNQQQVEAVSTEQAKQWIAQDSLVWAVVVKPWVLIQPIE